MEVIGMVLCWMGLHRFGPWEAAGSHYYIKKCTRDHCLQFDVRRIERE